MSWPMRQIVDVADILSGNAWKSANFSSDPSVGLPVIRIQNVSDTKTDFVYWDGEPLDKYIIKNGDLLLSLSGNVKLCQWQYGEALLNQRVVRLSPRAGVDTRYFYWSLRRVVQKIEALAKHAVIANVSVSDLKSFEIPLPPLTEQKRIANILDKADAIRHKRQQAIQLADEFLRAVFLDMFGDPVTNPKGWKIIDLANLIDPSDKLNYGVVQPGEHDIEGVPLVRSGDLGDRPPSMHSLRRVSVPIDHKHRKSRLKGNEILIACVGSIGKVGWVSEEMKGWNIARAVTRIPVKDDVNREYLYRYLQNPVVQGYFARETRAVAQPTLNVGLIAKTPIALPPIKFQKEFLRQYEKVSRLTGRFSLSVRDQDSLFGSISQKTFSGDL